MLFVRVDQPSIRVHCFNSGGERKGNENKRRSSGTKEELINVDKERILGSSMKFLNIKPSEPSGGLNWGELTGGEAHVLESYLLRFYSHLDLFWNDGDEWNQKTAKKGRTGERQEGGGGSTSSARGIGNSTIKHNDNSTIGTKWKQATRQIQQEKKDKLARDDKEQQQPSHEKNSMKQMCTILCCVAQIFGQDLREKAPTLEFDDHGYTQKRSSAREQDEWTRGSPWFQQQ